MNNNGYSYQVGKACIRALEADGWHHVATVLDDAGDGRVGMLFTKQDLKAYELKREFWLNKDTYKDLPLGTVAKL